jgi:hypothetical protein
LEQQAIRLQEQVKHLELLATELRQPQVRLPLI